MSKQLRMVINTISFNDDEVKSIQYAVKANVEFTYKVVNEDYFEIAEGTEETDKKVMRLIESLFAAYFMEVLSKKPKNQWSMCEDEFVAYVREKSLLLSGLEIEDVKLLSINDDEEHRKRMEQKQKEFNEHFAAKKAPVEPVESKAVANPFAKVLDGKRIITIAVVIIILIVGYFMK